MVSREQICGGRDEGAARTFRLLLQPDDPVVRGELDDAVQARERRVGELVNGDRAALPLGAPERHVLRERELEQVVAGHHEQVVAGEAGAIDDEADVSGRAEAVLVRRRQVVVKRHVPVGRPRLERGDLARVRHDVHLVDRIHRRDAVEDPVDDRTPADVQELLRQLVGERAQPRAVAGGEEDRLHAATTARASDSWYDAR